LDIKRSLLYKSLVIGVVILFLCVGIHPAVAEEDREQKTDVEIEGNEKSSGRGFIVCKTRFWSNIFDRYIPVPLNLVICENLDTGIIRFGFTHYLGFHVFKFLPMGHDYKLNVFPYPSHWGGEQTVYNLSYLDFAIFSI